MARTKTKPVSQQLKDRKGYTLQMESVPINGRIALRQPLEKPDHSGGENGHA